LGASGGGGCPPRGLLTEFHRTNLGSLPASKKGVSGVGTAVLTAVGTAVATAVRMAVLHLRRWHKRAEGQTGRGPRRPPFFGGRKAAQIGPVKSSQKAPRRAAAPPRAPIWPPRHRSRPKPSSSRKLQKCLPALWLGAFGRFLKDGGLGNFFYEKKQITRNQAI